MMDDELTNIWVASSDGSIQRVRELLKEGTCINVQDENGYSPIHAAVSYGHIDLVDFLLSHGANINLRDADGDTPILVCEEPQVFEFLVNRGANPKDINSIGETILDKAAQDENEALINYLVSNGYITRDEAEFYIKKTEMDRLAEIEEIGGEDDTINDDNDGSVIS